MIVIDAAVMTITKRFAAVLPLALLCMAVPALASDDEAELWLNQQISTDIGESTKLEFEIDERFRSDTFGGDQYEVRLGAYRDIGGGFKLGGGVVYQRTDTQDEVRLQQQLQFDTGPLSLRTRFEQRFIEDVGPTVYRLRQRVQLSQPLDEARRWTAFANAEGYFTLNESRPGALTGLTSLRTQIGVRRKLSGTVTMGLIYVRQQDVRRNAPDRVGHAPQLSVALSF